MTDKPRTTKSLSVSFKLETLNALDYYISKQDYKPTRSAVIQRALDLLWIEERKARR